MEFVFSFQIKNIEDLKKYFDNNEIEIIEGTLKSNNLGDTVIDID
jgi:hypothetical protein